MGLLSSKEVRVTRAGKGRREREYRAWSVWKFGGVMIIVKLKELTFIEHLVRAKRHVKYFTFNPHNNVKRQVLFYH